MRAHRRGGGGRAETLARDALEAQAARGDRQHAVPNFRPSRLSIDSRLCLACVRSTYKPALEGMYSTAALHRIARCSCRAVGVALAARQGRSRQQTKWVAIQPALRVSESRVCVSALAAARALRFLAARGTETDARQTHGMTLGARRHPSPPRLSRTTHACWCCDCLGYLGPRPSVRGRPCKMAKNAQTFQAFM